MERNKEILEIIKAEVCILKYLFAEAERGSMLKNMERQFAEIFARVQNMEDFHPLESCPRLGWVIENTELGKNQGFIHAYSVFSLLVDGEQWSIDKVLASNEWRLESGYLEQRAKELKIALQDLKKYDG